jgi:hypothetical protein
LTGVATVLIIGANRGIGLQTDDVADFLVKQIDNDAFLHKTPVLTS